MASQSSCRLKDLTVTSLSLSRCFLLYVLCFMWLCFVVHLEASLNKLELENFRPKIWLFAKCYNFGSSNLTLDLNKRSNQKQYQMSHYYARHNDGRWRRYDNQQQVSHIKGHGEKKKTFKRPLKDTPLKDLNRKL